MFQLVQNITYRERIVRGTIGAILLLGALMNVGRAFSVIIGLLLIVSAVLNYCGLYELIKRFKLDGGDSAASTLQTPPPENKPPL